jgi:hypothetical protein
VSSGWQRQRRAEPSMGKLFIIVMVIGVAALLVASIVIIQL